MNLKQAQTLQNLCTKHNAYGCEVWHLGVRFYLKSGKMSKIVSKKGLNLEVGMVWLNLDNFKTNVLKFRKQYHPDAFPKDSKWAAKLYSFVEQSLLSLDDPSNRFCSIYHDFWDGRHLNTKTKEINPRQQLARDESVDERKARLGKRYHQF